MRRREFIAGIGAAAWPVVSRAQQPAMPVIGYLNSRSPGEDPHLTASFREGLREAGYVEGQNVAIEYRFAENQYDRLPSLATELVRRRVNVIVAISQIAASAAKAATQDIPIVFVTGVNPVETGLVVSLRRPDGNLTGVTILSSELASKRLELLHELLPAADLIAYFINPTDQVLSGAETRSVQGAAQVLGVHLLMINASTATEIETAFENLAQKGARAALLSSDGLFMVSRRDQILALAARNHLPIIYDRRDSAAIGGLLSYGADTAGAHRLVGTYTGRILKGEKPTELPVQQSTKVELVINMKTARALGLTVPLPLLARADEVIE